MSKGLIRAAIALLLTFVISIGSGGLSSQFMPTLATPGPDTVILARKPVSISTVSITQLPPEVKTTLVLIRRGGPFPYRKDGTVFGNRERRLPAAPAGYYREYTVPTPGSPDRGARRLVTGQQQEIYYTGDHYRSFVRVKP